MNSLESFPAWCSVDTKIGAITVQLHEFNCFDCEMYADEIELPPDYEVREDQRRECISYESFSENTNKINSSQSRKMGTCSFIQQVHKERIRTPRSW